MQKKIKIGARGSRLALRQAAFTQSELLKIGIESELILIESEGDGVSLQKIEDALLRGDCDVAAHSMKNLPIDQPEGLVVTAVSDREDPSEWLVIRKTSLESGQIFGLKKGATVGASSNRRKTQMLDLRPDCQIADLDDDVPTRLEKLKNGPFDAVFLAGADFLSLQIEPSEDFEIRKIAPQEFVPAPAQGVLAWQTNAGDLETRRIFKKLHRAEVSACTNVERAVLKLMDGGGQSSLGVFCERDGANNFHVWAACFLENALRRVRVSSSTSFGLAERVVAELRK